MKNYESFCGTCEDRKPGPECECSPMPVPPPPIPPICPVPGLNTHEQLCHVIKEANRCIAKWNEISCKCYEALHKTVSAAKANAVYYNFEEVGLKEGYSTDAGAAYAYVDIACVDKCGKPIYIKLHPAFGNEGMANAREPIDQASLYTFANAMMTAVNPLVNGWNGPVLFHGCPANYAESNDTWLAGFNRHGTLRVFKGSVKAETLQRNQMVDVIGPAWPIIQDGAVCTDLISDKFSLDTPMAITAMGFRASNGSKMFFSCGLQDEPGMSITNVANEMLRMGCTTAVLTCAMDGYPGTAAIAASAAPNSVNDGLTSGLLYVGKNTTTPINFYEPKNTAFWYVSKFQKEWKNDHETLDATMPQLYGDAINQLSGIKDAVDTLYKDVTDVTSRVDGLETTVTDNSADIQELQGQVETIQNKLDTLEPQIQTAIEQAQKATEDVANMQQQLTEEITARNEADTNLTNALNNEINTRSTADTAINTRIDNLETKTGTDIQGVNDKIDDILNGTTPLPVATKDSLGVIKVGNNLVISEDGTLSATGGGGGTAIEAGDGIVLTDNTSTGAKIVSVDSSVAKKSDVAAVDTKANTNAAAITNIETNLDGVQDSISKLTESQESQDQIIEQQNQRIDGIKTDVDSIKDGSGLPIATAEKLGAIRVGANLSIDENGVLSAQGQGPAGETVAAGTGINVVHNEGVATVSVDDTIATVEALNAVDTKVGANTTELESQDSRITAAENSIMGIENGSVPLGYVKKTGDTMTGDLKVNASITSNDSITSRGNSPSVNVQAQDMTAMSQLLPDSLSLSKDGNMCSIKSESTGLTMSSKAGVVNLKDPADAGVQIKNVAAGADEKDAVNVGQLNAVEAKADSAQAQANKGVSDAAAALSAAQAAQNTADANTTAIDSLESGGTELPYVKKRGDTMTGDLTTTGLLLAGGGRISDADGNLTLAPAADRRIFVNTLAGSNSLISKVADPIEPSDAATKNYADTKVNKSGDTMTGSLTITEPGAILVNRNDKTAVYGATDEGDPAIRSDTNNIKLLSASGYGGLQIKNVLEPTDNSDAATKTYADSKVSKSGDTMTGNLTAPNIILNHNGHIRSDGTISVTNLAGDNYQELYVKYPSSANAAATKQYVDNMVNGNSSAKFDIINGGQAYTVPGAPNVICVEVVGGTDSGYNIVAGSSVILLKGGVTANLSAIAANPQNAFNYYAFLVTYNADGSITTGNTQTILFRVWRNFQ